MLCAWHGVSMTVADVQLPENDAVEYKSDSVDVDGTVR
jgi:hypothetical protein